MTRVARGLFLTTIATCFLLRASQSLSQAADSEYQSVVRALVARLEAGEAIGKALFADDFEGGNLDAWTADAGWSVVDGPAGGKYARVVSSAADFEDLILKQKIPVEPGHPLAVCWKVRWESGSAPLFLRVDFFDAQGKQGQPYARQEPSRQSGQWSGNAVLVSDWFPEYTRSITVHFHHDPKAQTTSLLDDVRVVDLAEAARDALSARLRECLRLADALGVNAKALRPSPTNDRWRKLVAARLPALRRDLQACNEMDPASEEFTRTLKGPSAWVMRMTEIIAALRRGDIATTPLVVYSTRPVTSTMVLPDSVELPGRIATCVELAACRGEYEPASLVLWSPEPVAGLLPRVTDLRGLGGVIPAASIDLRYVKCWYQAGTAWYGVGQDLSRKVLIPELLVKDDTLVRVDREAQHNYLKLSFPEGPRYVPIDDPTPVAWGSRLATEEFPVRDSDRLMPLDLPAGENKQLWVTVKVPDDAKPGLYLGSIGFSAQGRDLGHVELAVRVLPFSLHVPRAHYDLSKPFTGSLYYWGELDPEGKPSIGHKYKSEEQFRAELQMMYDHGIVAPAMIWSPSLVYDNEPLFRRHLQIVREIGMSGRPLYFADSGMVGNPTEPAALEALKERVRRTIRIAREYGFTQVYFYGLDEAQGERLKSQRPAWEAVHEAGGRIFVSGYAEHLATVGDLLDQLNRAGNPEGERADEWHRRGHTVWNYGNPQTPVENPEVYRRNYGLFLWRLDFDGSCTYCFIDSSGISWNDLDCETYRDHCLAYPTMNGVVGTLAIEGFREGQDDVRYATTLRLAAEKAAAGGSAEAKATVTRAIEWLEGLNTKTADLDEVRATMIRYLEELSQAP